MLAVSVRHVRRLIAGGTLPPVRIGRAGTGGALWRATVANDVLLFLKIKPEWSAGLSSLGIVRPALDHLVAEAGGHDLIPGVRAGSVQTSG